MRRLYPYVGPRDLLQLVASQPMGTALMSAADVRAWVAAQSHRHDPVVATYVVDADGRLLVADRHSEHVVCAGGEPVLAAGELVFDPAPSLVVSGVTNQSTGYCPEPECWTVVRAALEALEIDVPPGFTPPFVFRRCEHCGQINVVKDDEWLCAVCGTALPSTWNFA